MFLNLKTIYSLICVPSTCADTDQPECIQFTATLRAMPIGAIDFEARQCCSNSIGMLSSILDGNRLRFPPYRLRAPNTLKVSGTFRSEQLSNYGQFMFDEWYMDIPRFNIPAEYVMNLTLGANGIYKYNSANFGGFFPLDKKGYIEEYRGSQGGGHKFSFTTYVTYPFFYRGGEKFDFSGDDDLWVFLNKKLVVACDVGGVHGATPCSFLADSLGLTINTTYTLDVFNAERHVTGSNFVLSTSILPRNIPPVSSNMSITVNGPSDTGITLPAYDGNAETLVVKIYPPYPSFGSLIIGDITINSDSVQPFFTVSTLNMRYVANSQYIGYNKFDTFYYSITDHCVEVAMFKVDINIVGNLVQTVFLPPILRPIFNVTLQRGEIASVNVTASDPQDRKLSYLDDTQFAYLWTGCINVLKLDQQTGKLQIQGVKGNCLFSYLVSNKVVDPPTQGFIQIYVLDPYVPPTREETIIQIAPPVRQTDEVIVNVITTNTGIPQEIVNISLAVGISVIMMIAAAVIAWILYTKVLWKRFEAQWKNEFLSAEIKDNPLYKSSAKETFNPLYQGEDTTGTSVPQNSTVNRESYAAAQATKSVNRQSQLGASRSSVMTGAARQSRVGLSGSQGKDMGGTTNRSTVLGSSTVGPKNVLGAATLNDDSNRLDEER